MAVDNPSISIILPIYNSEKYLKEALQSIFRQTYRSYEVIAVDDGSTDASREILQHSNPSIHYFYQDTHSPGATRNRGIRESRAGYLAFLDADDLWAESKLELQMNYFKHHPETELIFGHARVFHSPELSVELKEKIFCPPEPVPGITPSAMLIKREAFLKVGDFDEDQQLTAFAKWYVRAKELGVKTAILAEVVTLRRLHEANDGILQREHQANYLRMLHEHLEWKRNQGP